MRVRLYWLGSLQPLGFVSHDARQADHPKPHAAPLEHRSSVERWTLIVPVTRLGRQET